MPVWLLVLLLDSSSSSSSGTGSIAGAVFTAVIAGGGDAIASLDATGNAAESVTIPSTVAGLGGTEVGAAGGVTGPAAGPALLRLDVKDIAA